MKKHTLQILALTWLLLANSAPVQAMLKVIATMSDYAALVSEIGGAQVSVETFAKGTQDPHFIEAKPSFMMKASTADLVVANGLDLEIGWLPSILRGARNPKIATGSRGYIELGAAVPVLERPGGNVSRADGDVHPDGNPHVTLDPIRMGTMARALATRLGELDVAHAKDFAARADAFGARMERKCKRWGERLTKSGVKEVVTYHKMLTYFLNRFHVANAVFLEPKPGIPPTAAHLLEVVHAVKDRHIPLVLVENYFDAKGATRIAEEAPGTRVQSVAVSVGGSPEVKTLDDLYESLVAAFENNGTVKP